MAAAPPAWPVDPAHRRERATIGQGDAESRDAGASTRRDDGVRGLGREGRCSASRRGSRTPGRAGRARRSGRARRRGGGVQLARLGVAVLPGRGCARPQRGEAVQGRGAAAGGQPRQADAPADALGHAAHDRPAMVAVAAADCTSGQLTTKAEVDGSTFQASTRPTSAAPAGRYGASRPDRRQAGRRRRRRRPLPGHVQRASRNDGPCRRASAVLACPGAAPRDAGLACRRRPSSGASRGRGVEGDLVGPGAIGVGPVRRARRLPSEPEPASPRVRRCVRPSIAPPPWDQASAPCDQRSSARRTCLWIWQTRTSR